MVAKPVNAPQDDEGDDSHCEQRGSKPEQPTIGRDGKWQLNLYDPDLTRVELMEFKPVRKPCCSPMLSSPRIAP